ncbi:MDR family MFS transporter [Kordia jejudonensis]|uniref:MDR family MFS transporter n=1 Tax=Kordia jejudonensis TaxID=1348245 RepID=UPI0006295A03|nr:MFS transporter [Kordia jejudonensis]
MKKMYLNYIDSFKGLSKEIWFLALISLVNRAGTMVIPFLSLYLTKELNFSESDAGSILVFFGIGSLFGSFLGGKLVDKVGFYKIMIFSLFVTGFGFIGLQYVSSFWGLCFAILGIMTIADMFRPAIFVSLKAYSKPENQTRSLALIRLAINLGMGIGPTLAGWIIVTKGYNILFWIDGITCIIAIVIFYMLVKEQKRPVAENSEEVTIVDKNAAYKDKSYWIFIAICFFMGMAFFQLIITMPIYQNDQFGLTEFDTGLIMFINVAIIVIFEMPFINYLEQRNISATKLIIYGSILFGLSFYVLLYNVWVGMLIVSIVIITLGEMIGFPYTNAYAINRAKDGNEGSYMALYAMAFSLAHIFSSKTGLEIVANFGHQVNWFVTGTFGVIGAILAIWLHKRTQKGL